MARHVRFLAHKNPTAARRTKKELMYTGGFLLLNTEFLPLNKYHRMFVEKWYLILYQIKDQTVYVDYIVDVAFGKRLQLF